MKAIFGILVLFSVSSLFATVRGKLECELYDAENPKRKVAQSTLNLNGGYASIKPEGQASKNYEILEVSECKGESEVGRFCIYTRAFYNSDWMDFSFSQADFGSYMLGSGFTLSGKARNKFSRFIVSCR